MAIVNFRVTAYTIARHTIAGRLTARLSTGVFVGLVFDVSGTTPQIHLYTSPDTVSAWTLRASVNANNGTAAAPQAWTLGAICIDDSDNVHMAGTTWYSTAPTKPGISYWKFTNAGAGAFTAGSPVVIVAPGVYTSNSLGLDIDFVGAGTNGRPIIALSGTTVTAAYCRYYLINGSSAVLLATPGSAIPAGATQVAKYLPLRSAAISGRHQNETDSTIVFMYVYLTTNGGFKYALAKVNNTGTTITGYGLGLFGDVGPLRVQMSWAGDTQVILTVSIAGKVVVERFQWNASYTLTRDFYQFVPVPGPGYFYMYTWVPFVISATRVAIFYSSNDGSTVSVFYIDLIAGGTFIATGALTWENFANMSVAQRPVRVTSVHGNFNRGFERNQLDPNPLADYATKDRVPRVIYGHSAQRAALVPSAIVPAPGSTVITDIPAVSANIGADAYGTQSDYTVTWQFATEITFAAPLSTTSSLVASGGQAKKILEVLNKLTAQGLWYMRSRTTDRYGNVSAWSTAQTFTNSHLPVASLAYPIGDQIVPWNSGNVTFDWDFKDSSPTASQSAYQIALTNTADGSLVLDTGLIASAATQAVVAVPVGYKDLELSWTVTLTDDQGVAGISSLPQSFFASDPPAPIISTPVPFGVATSGIMTVAWDPGIPGTNKSQARFRIVVQEGSKVLHDSGTLISNATTYKLPVGVIRNAHAYNISLTVWDTINLSGRTNVSFSASFTPPPSPSAVKVFTYNYESSGYVWVGWTNAAADPDFAYYNLYRRVQGQTLWTLLETIYATQDFYGYADYTAATNVQYEYVVTQVINFSGTGDFVESTFTSLIVATFGGSNYWLIDPQRAEPPLPIYQVTVDGYTDEYERNTYTIIGRGRHTDIGEHMGINGSITTQARDRPIGQASPVANGFADASFQNGMPFSPQWALAFSSGGSTAGVLPYECAPSRHENVLRVDASVGSSAGLSQTLPKKVVISSGDRFSLNAYLDDLLNAYNFTVQFVITWLDSASATIGTQTVNANQIENWQGNGNWFRYGVEAFCNLATGISPAAMKVQILVTDTSGNGLSFLIDACMANYGLTVPYGDADMPGWAWDGAPNVSGSYTNGYYTARSQRKDIVALSSADTPGLLLRTPFGDVWNVAVQDIAFARMPGTGSQVEYGDITIPYLEVAD